MRHIPQHLVPGERIIYEGKLHWTVIVLMTLVFIPTFQFVACLSPLIFTRGSMDLSCLFGVIALVLAPLSAVMVRESVEYALTDRRVIKKTGLIGRNFRELPLDKIETIEVNEPLIGRILGYKDLVITGTGGSRLPILRIADAEDLRRLLMESLSRRKQVLPRQESLAWQGVDGSTRIFAQQYDRARQLYRGGKKTEAIAILEMLADQGYGRATDALRKIRAAK